MDIFALNHLLKDSIDYEDIGKQKFLNKLHKRFSHHKTLGDREFLLDLVKCNGCQSPNNVCSFIGNNSEQSFALYFKFSNGKIKDIFHCTWYGEMDFWDSI